jgi:hypothetical protein
VTLSEGGDTLLVLAVFLITADRSCMPHFAHLGQTAELQEGHVQGNRR